MYVLCKWVVVSALSHFYLGWSAPVEAVTVISRDLWCTWTGHASLLQHNPICFWDLHIYISMRNSLYIQYVYFAYIIIVISIYNITVTILSIFFHVENCTGCGLESLAIRWQCAGKGYESRNAGWFQHVKMLMKKKKKKQVDAPLRREPLIL